MPASSQTALYDASLFSSHPGRPVHLDRQPRSPRPSRGPEPLIAPEPLIVPARAANVHLSPEEIRKLRFKPTVGSVNLSEGMEVKLNCSIDVSDSVKQDLAILWMKNGQELHGSIQTDLFSGGRVSLLSTLR